MADPAIIDNRTLVWLVSAAFGAMATVIGVLWQRVDKTNAKCIEDRDKQNQDRAVENKAWFDRVEGLYKERDIQNRGMLEQVAKMFDQVVKLTEKSKDSEHATINALVETGRMVGSINDTLTSLTGKIDALGKDIRLSHEQTKNPPGG